jgi:Reverse transcriptase (RNA-dependent DNA polymerase)
VPPHFLKRSSAPSLWVDFSKAFDTVAHAIILRKISILISLLWSIINWIISLLIDRKIQLKRGVILSQPKQINRGIVQGSGIGPTLYIVQESDLIPLSLVNILLKYADSTRLLLPKNTDVPISQEFDTMKTFHNKMITNFSRTKEIVYFRPNPYCSVHPFPVDDIELLLEAKLLGVILNGKFHFDSDLQLKIHQCSQRLHLMKLLRKQGLPPEQMGIAYLAIIISRIQNAISA